MDSSFGRIESVFEKPKIYTNFVNVIDKIVERLDLNVEIVKNVEDADFVIAHKNFTKSGAKVLSIANEYRLPIYYVRTNSMPQIQKVLKQALDIRDDDFVPVVNYEDDAERALDEAKDAIQKVLDGEESEIELQPQNPQIRKMQHELVEQHNLRSDSIGDGSQRRLKIVGGTDFKQDVG